MGIATGTAHANVNRRERKPDGRIVLGVNPDGPVDCQIGLLRLERPDRTPIGLIANYAIHGTVLGGNNKQISGDVMGFTAEYVERQAGAPLLFINGAEGNVAPLYSVGADINNPNVKKFEALLGDQILATSNSIAETTENVSLAIGHTVIETPRKAGLAWPDELAEYASVSPDGSPQVRVPVYTLTINRDTVLWAAPLELFSEIALNIRAASPFTNTYYFGLTNGSLLYMPTKAAFAEGGYEPNVSPFTDRAEADFTVWSDAVSAGTAPAVNVVLVRLRLLVLGLETAACFAVGCDKLARVPLPVETIMAASDGTPQCGSSWLSGV